MRRLLALLLALLPATALAWKHGIYSAPPVASSKAMPIGAGGWIVGLQMAADGTRFARTDTYGAWVWDTTLSPPTWRQVVTVSGMPPGQVSEDIAAGVYEIAIAPTNTRHLWMYFNGYVFKSTDFGKHWTQTAFAQVPADPNQCVRLFGHFMAIDPSNENNVFVGTPSNGMFVTHNGGSTWAAVPTVPGGNLPSSGVCPSGSTIGGGNIILFVTSSHLFAGSYGNGIYESTNGGASWTALAGSPLNPKHMAWSSTGGLFVTNNTGATQIYNYTGGVWTPLPSTPFSITPHAIAIDPANPNRIAVSDVSGPIQTSTDLGVDWSPYNGAIPRFSFVTGANDIPWLSWAQNLAESVKGFGLSSGDIAFDPTQSNVLYQSAGVGVWYGSPDDSGVTPITWTSQSRGIEQLVSTGVYSIPGGSVQTSQGDRYTFNAGAMLTWPTYYSPTISPTVGYGVGFAHVIDYNWANPAALVGLMNWPTNPVSLLSSYSLDGGVNWTKFQTIPTPEANAVYGGSIAIDDQNDIVIIPCGTQAYRSVIPGATWTATLPSTNYWCYNNTTNRNWWFLRRKIVASDRVLTKTFYAYNYIDGMYKSTDGGVTWTLVHSGPLDTAPNADAFNATLRANPTIAGDLFFTAGPVSGSTPPSSQPFWHSTDGGATWVQVLNVLEVRAFGFGVPAPGHTPGAVYINGWADCSSGTITCNPAGSGYQFGIFQSKDDGATFVQVAIYLNDSFDFVDDINGDMNSYGRFFTALQGSGFAIGVTPDAVLKPVVALENVNVATPNQATITWSTDIAATNSVDYGTTSAYGTHVAASSGLNPSVTLTGLANYTTYHYRANTGVSSSMDLTFLTANTVAPGVPTGLSAIAANDAQVNLSWTASSPGPQPVAGYKIYSSGTLVCGAAPLPACPTGTTFTFSAQPSTAYSFTVASYDASGNVSAQSSSASATTPAAAVTWAATDNPSAVPQTALATTFGSPTPINLGAADPNRQTLVCATVASDHATLPYNTATPVEHITGVTLDSGSGPVAMTQVADATHHGNNYGAAAIKLYRLATPTGATGTIVVTTDILNSAYSGGPAVAITVGRLITTTPTPSATKAALWIDDITGGYTPTTPINVPAFGVAVMCGASAGPIAPVSGGGIWVNGTADLTSVNGTGAYWWSTLAHLYSVGNQYPAMCGYTTTPACTPTANGFGMAIGAWAP
jgi:hypothetical protein